MDKVKSGYFDITNRQSNFIYLYTQKAFKPLEAAAAAPTAAGPAPSAPSRSDNSIIL